MSKPTEGHETYAIVILSDTPESLVEGMDSYTRRLMSLRWYDFAEKEAVKALDYPVPHYTYRTFRSEGRWR